MEKLVEKGLVKSIGLSNFNSQQISEIMAIAKIQPVTNQVLFLGTHYTEFGCIDCSQLANEHAI